MNRDKIIESVVFIVGLIAGVLLFIIVRSV